MPRAGQQIATEPAMGPRNRLAARSDTARSAGLARAGLHRRRLGPPTGDLLALVAESRPVRNGEACRVRSCLALPPFARGRLGLERPLRGRAGVPGATAAGGLGRVSGAV